MKEQYISFDEYIHQGKPMQREVAYTWSTAIGLQTVDGLKTSEYLNKLARWNIEGEITIDEVEQLLNSYYESKTVREADDDDKEISKVRPAQPLSPYLSFGRMEGST